MKKVMSTEEEVKLLAEKVIRDLVSGKYKLACIGEHVSDLVYGENLIQVWSCSGASSCSIYGDIAGMKLRAFTDEEKAIIFKIATTETVDSVKGKLRKAVETKVGLYSRYKESSREVVSLREQLKSIQVKK